MPKIKVGVLRGGPSAEHEVSLLTGANVLKNLPSDKYQGQDILISKEGKWSKMPKVDIVFNALHGEYGEDGWAQAVLEERKLFYTGSGVKASALAMNKWLAREFFQKAGLKIPPAVKIEKFLPGSAAEPKFSLPWIIKPVNRGSSVGISLVKNLSDFSPALQKALQYDNSVLVEKFIIGQEATAGVLENFQGQKIFTLPVVEIIPPIQKNFFDYQCKYDGTSREICPGRFDKKTTLAIQKAAGLAHQILGCRDYSRTDLIVAKDGIYVLEVNTLPGLTQESLLPKAAAQVGCSFDQLLDHLLTLALERKGA